MRASHVVAGMKHEVIDNELTASVKQVSESLTPVRSIKNIVFADGLPRKLATLLIELVAKAGEFLFFGEERGSRGEPVVMRYDWMVLYVAAAVVGHAVSSPYDMKSGSGDRVLVHSFAPLQITFQPYQHALPTLGVASGVLRCAGESLVTDFHQRARARLLRTAAM